MLCAAAGEVSLSVMVRIGTPDLAAFLSNISNRKIIAGEREKDYQVTIRQLLDNLLGDFQIR